MGQARRWGWLPGWLRRAPAEPLVQFLCVGLILFAINAAVRGPAPPASGDAIVITPGKVTQLIDSYVLMSGHAPSRKELQSLVDDYVTEEIDYREAVAMGLDADDAIVRRRMRQKLEFLVEDADASEEPSEAQLKEWLAGHADRYQLPERRAIRQVMASRDKRGEGARALIGDWMRRLASGTDPAKLGDSSMLPAALSLTTEEGMVAVFGEAFAREVFVHSGKGWFGPVASAFGEHAVLVVDTEAGRAALFGDVRDRLRSDWIEAHRAAARDAHQARMRKRYHVRVEWPEPYNDLPATPDPAPAVRAAPREVGE